MTEPLKTLGAILDELAAARPEESLLTTAMNSGATETVSRHELKRWSDNLAQALLDLGVMTGDLVPIHLPTCNQFLVAAVAIFKAGGTPMPVSSKLPPAELMGLIDLAQPKVIISYQRFDQTTLNPDSYSDKEPISAALPHRVSNPIKALASGGSTGKPKLILTTGDALFDPENPIIPQLMRFEPGDLKYSPGPLYHNGPFWFSLNMLIRGGRVLLNERFNAARCLDLIEAYRPTVLNLVPTMMQRMLREPDWQQRNLDSVRVLWHLAAPCPSWAKEGFIEKLGGERVLELWAATEANGLTIIDGNEWLQHKGSVGKGIGTEILILDEDRQPLPNGEVGEIFTRIAGAPPPCEYLGSKPLENLREGFTSVGDLGWLDSEGYLYLADRRTDLIISGGSNIFPAEVEAVITQHPKVCDAAVIGLQDNDLGRRVHAVVEPLADGNNEALSLEVMDLCREQLLSYKVPRTIELVETLPRNEAGKIRRTWLRDQRDESANTSA
jgi:bile acid-coenzyme A ligase